MKLWEYLNGRKTTIGATVLAVALFLQKIVVGEWGIEAEALRNIIATLEWIGLFLAPTGLVHKGAKKLGLAQQPKRA